jgi:DNA-binding NarL/FixJ family response regulator
MHVVASISNGENILDLIDKHKPNLMLLDLIGPNNNSLQIVKLSKKEFPELKIIVMDLLPLQSNVFDFVQAGVSGFILKDANTVEFVKTIRSVFIGAKVLPEQLTCLFFSQIAENSINEVKPSEIVESVNMTKRERQVIALIAASATNKEIAQKLNLSLFTVKSHVHNILEKLAISKRIQIEKHARLTEYYKTI